MCNTNSIPQPNIWQTLRLAKFYSQLWASFALLHSQVFVCISVEASEPFYRWRARARAWPKFWFSVQISIGLNCEIDGATVSLIGAFRGLQTSNGVTRTNQQTSGFEYEYEWEYEWEYEREYECEYEYEYEYEPRPSDERTKAATRMPNQQHGESFNAAVLVKTGQIESELAFNGLMRSSRLLLSRWAPRSLGRLRACSWRLHSNICLCCCLFMKLVRVAHKLF